MQIQISGYTIGTALDVTVTGSTESGVTCRTTLIPKNAGYVNVQYVNDTGSATGSVNVVSTDVTQDYRNRAGLDTIHDYECFNYTNQNVNKHFYRNTTLAMNMTVSGLTTNSAGVTTQNTGVALNTHRYFPIYTNAPIYAEFNMSFNQPIPTNTVLNFGLFQPGSANFYNPLDGCGFRYSTYSGMTGFQNVNGTEYVTTAFTFAPITGVNYHYVMEIMVDFIFYYINDVLYKIQNRTTTQDHIQMSGAQPLCISHYITNDGIAGGVFQACFTSYQISCGDLYTFKPWNYQMAGMGMGGNLLPDGQASGSYQTASYPLYNAVIGTSTPVSGGTTSANGLGGRTSWAPVSSENALERILFWYQVPSSNSATTARNLYITGVKISSMVTSTISSPTAGFNSVQYDLGYGSTTLALDGVEAASFAATTKAYRKLPLGNQSFVTTSGGTTTSFAGTIAKDVIVDLSVPVVVCPGEYIAIIMRELNTNASGVISTGVDIDSYWE